MTLISQIHRKIHQNNTKLFQTENRYNQIILFFKQI